MIKNEGKYRVSAFHTQIYLWLKTKVNTEFQHFIPRFIMIIIARSRRRRRRSREEYTALTAAAAAVINRQHQLFWKLFYLLSILQCIKSSSFFPLPPTLPLFVSLSPIVSLSQSSSTCCCCCYWVLVAAAEVFCRKFRSPLNPTTHPPAPNQQFGNFHKGIVVIVVIVGLLVCLFVCGLLVCLFVCGGGGGGVFFFLLLLVADSCEGKKQERKMRVLFNCQL